MQAEKILIGFFLLYYLKVSLPELANKTQDVKFK